MVANAALLVETLAEPTRHAIVEQLAAHPSSVSDIARRLPITRSAVSQHLQLLKSVGLVSVRPEGTRHIYHVDPAALAIIREYFDAFWRRSLDSFQRVTEQSDPTERTP